mmetsp:Transcript_17817/g.50167  ORF Transcript_17817/g.50167 Transcript_17817/m.50167 type:complete len:404 (-) Transcript_17817:1015-2226(-)
MLDKHYRGTGDLWLVLRGPRHDLTLVDSGNFEGVHVLLNKPAKIVYACDTKCGSESRLVVVGNVVGKLEFLDAPGHHVLANRTELGLGGPCHDTHAAASLLEELDLPFLLRVREGLQLTPAKLLLLLLRHEVLPGVLHSPNGEGSHVTNGTVVALGVPGLRRLVHVSDRVVGDVCDTVCRLEALHQEALLHHGRCGAVRGPRPHLDRLEASLVNLAIGPHAVHWAALPVAELLDVELMDGGQGALEALRRIDRVQAARAGPPLPAAHVRHNGVVLGIVAGVVIEVSSVPELVVVRLLGALQQLVVALRLTLHVHLPTHGRRRGHRRQPQPATVGRRPQRAPRIVRLVRKALVLDEPIPILVKATDVLEALFHGLPAFKQELLVLGDLVVTPHLQRELTVQVLP